MEKRSWFWRKIGWLFVPVNAQTLRPLGWSKIRRFYRWGSSRRARRGLVLFWTVSFVFLAWITFWMARNSAILGFEYAVIWILVAWCCFRAMRIRLAQPTLEDRAAMEHGAEFDALTERQRGELFHRQIQDSFMGVIKHDEREAELRLRSEGAAYRLLRPGLLVAVAAYSGVCLFGPFAHEREMLATTAIAFTWLALGVLVLPTMVRMWTQSDEVGEPRMVGSERDA